MSNNPVVNKSIYLFLVLLLVFSACEDESIMPDQEEEEESDSLVFKTVNVLIFHEGGFGATNATIGSYNPSNESYTPTSYRNENASFIGDVQQSVVSEQGSFYSVLNGSNAVKIVDSASLAFSATIENELIDKPRDFAVLGETGYISNWGPYNADFGLSDSRILTVDLNSNEVTGSIKTQAGLEDVQIVGNTLLATRFYFGSFQHLTFINTESNEVTADIELPAGPEEILIDESNNVWVVCNSGALVRIDVEKNSIAETVDLGGPIFADAAVHQDAIYFLQGNEIKAYNLSSGEINSIGSTLEIELPYGFGIDPTTGDIYISDGVDYSDAGKVLIYSAEGLLLNEFTSGILPTQFIFETEFQVFEEE